MRTFKDAIGEVKFSINKIILFDVLLNSIILFLVLYLLLSILNILALWAIIPAIIYFFYTSIKRTSVNKIRTIERKYPEMDEKFRTAVDNQSKHNIMVNELQAEILRDLRNVEEASFFNEKRTYTKSAIVIGLCFVIIFLSPIGLNLFGININIPSIGDNIGFLPDANDDGAPDGLISIGGPKGAGLIPTEADIYGDVSVAKLGDKTLNLRIKPSGNEINIRQQTDIQDKDFQESYPDEVYVSSSETFKEEIPKDVEEQQIVKNYFRSLATG